MKRVALVAVLLFAPASVSADTTAVSSDATGITAVASRAGADYESLEALAAQYGLSDELAAWIAYGGNGGAAYPLDEGTGRIVVDSIAVRLDVTFGAYAPLPGDHRWVGLARQATSGE